jgi:hypothetical protein
MTDWMDSLSTPEREMLLGYMDGFNLDNPEPSENRSHSYRHGFANGRDDRNRSPRAFASTLREHAEAAKLKDMIA